MVLASVVGTPAIVLPILVAPQNFKDGYVYVCYYFLVNLKYLLTSFGLLLQIHHALMPEDWVRVFILCSSDQGIVT